MYASIYITNTFQYVKWRHCCTLVVRGWIINSRVCNSNQLEGMMVDSTIYCFKVDKLSPHGHSAILRQVNLKKGSLSFPFTTFLGHKQQQLCNSQIKKLPLKISSGFGMKWPSVLRHLEWIKRFPVQTPLGTQTGLGTHPCYEDLGELWEKCFKK